MLENEKFKSNEVLTTGQIAKICRVDPRTVSRWIEEGALRAYELPVTGHKRVEVENFIKFLKSHTIPLSDEFRFLLRPRILVVDDEEGIRNAIKRMLLYPDAEAYEVEFAADGFDAGQKISTFKPDLVILDVFMPKLDGLTVLRSLRSHSATRHIRTIVMSSLVRQSEEECVIRNGADAFVAKPFQEEDMKRNIERLLDRRSQ